MRIAEGHSVRASDVTTRAAQLMALLTRRPGPPETDNYTERNEEGLVARLRLRQAGAVPVLEAFITDAAPLLRSASIFLLLAVKAVQFYVLTSYLICQRSTAVCASGLGSAGAPLDVLWGPGQAGSAL